MSRHSTPVLGTPEAGDPYLDTNMHSLAGRMAAIYRVLRRRHGVYVRPLFLALLFGALRGSVFVGMKLDTVRLRGTRATRPIVLVGNPRFWSKPEAVRQRWLERMYRA